MDDVIKTFDWKADRLILAFPSTIESSGPYVIDISVLGDGAPLFKTQLTFIADQPPAKLGLPADAHVVRLSPDAGWTQQVEDLKKVMEESKAKYAPGERSLEFHAVLNTSIDPKMRDVYCKPDAPIPGPILLLEHGPQIRRVDPPMVTQMLVMQVKNNCMKPPPA